jgi:hypothetical protein
MRSTRDDVIRLLGPSADDNETRSKYDLETEDVYIVFSSEWSYQKCATELPTGTVLLIKITPKVEMKLSNIQVDQERLKEFDPSEPPNIGYSGYIDEEQGVVIRTLNGRIEEINYIAAKRDRGRCTEYYENPRKFVDILVDFRGSEKQTKEGSNEMKKRRQKSVRKP